MKVSVWLIKKVDLVYILIASSWKATMVSIECSDDEAAISGIVKSASGAYGK